MGDENLMNPDGTCVECGHLATEHASGCSVCDCELVAEAAKETEAETGIEQKIGTEFGICLRRP
jgi:hypothetical protein